MAKLGIALGSGPRGLGFESRYSDQKCGNRFRGSHIFHPSRDSKWRPARSSGKKYAGGILFSPWENPILSVLRDTFIIFRQKPESALTGSGFFCAAIRTGRAFSSVGAQKRY